MAEPTNKATTAVRGQGEPDGVYDYEWPMDSAWFGSLEPTPYLRDDGSVGPAFDQNE